MCWYALGCFTNWSVELGIFLGIFYIGGKWQMTKFFLCEQIISEPGYRCPGIKIKYLKFMWKPAGNYLGKMGVVVIIYGSFKVMLL